MEILHDYSLEELKTLFCGLNEKPYRAAQVFKGLHSGKKISELTDLSKELRNELTEKYADEPVKILGEKTSKTDGTRKFLFELSDGNLIEGVLMKYKYGYTQCVSTQVGCRMGCVFCASTLNGLVRNLTSGEILAQITTVNRLIGGKLGDKRAVTNVVLMGSGEPLDNYDNVLKFLNLVSSADGIGISQRNISLSTCGIVPKMYALADSGVSVNLTVSLHEPFDDERAALMPVAKSFKISEILKACDYYFEKTGRRYIFEYSLVKGKNDDKRCSDELARLLRCRPCHVNLIRLNEVKERGLKSTGDKNAYEFAAALEKSGLSATVRRQMGADIDGACGQLRANYIKNGENGELFWKE